MSIVHKYITSSDGTRLFAQAAGNPANPALVCVHGFACTSFAFRKQFANPYLLAHVYVIAWDLRGNGRSDMPEEPEAYEGKKMVEDFQAVCAAFGVTRPFLLGWSLGGNLVLDLLNVLPPSYLRGVIYTGGGTPSRALNDPNLSPLFLSLLPPLNGSDATAMSKAALEFFDCLLAQPQELSYEDRMRALGELMLTPSSTRVVYATVTAARDTSTFRERIKHLPVLVIQGTDDKICDVHMYKEMMDDILSGQDYEWLWMEGVGHTPFWEKTEVHDEAVVNFVKRLTSV